MSENFTKPANNDRKLDTRSFIIIWNSLPDVGRASLVDAMAQKGVDKMSLYKWARGGGVRLRLGNILRDTLREVFGITTKLWYLFPDKATRKEQAEYYKMYGARRQKGWDGKVDWPSLHKNEEDEQEKDY